MKKKLNSVLVVAFFAILLVSCTTVTDLSTSNNPLIETQKEAVVAKIEQIKTGVVKTIEDALYQPIVKTYELMGYRLKVTADKGVAYVEYPSIIAESDIHQAVSAAVAAYGDYLKDVTYSVKDGVITVNYPESYGEEEFALAEKIIAKELPAYISSVLVQQNKISEKSIVEQITETIATKKDEAKTESVKTAKTESVKKAKTNVASSSEPAKQQETKMGLNLSRTHIIIPAAVVAVGFILFLLLHKKKDE